MRDSPPIFSVHFSGVTPVAQASVMWELLEVAATAKDVVAVVCGPHKTSYWVVMDLSEREPRYVEEQCTVQSSPWRDTSSHFAKRAYTYTRVLLSLSVCVNACMCHTAEHRFQINHLAHDLFVAPTCT